VKGGGDWPPPERGDPADRSTTKEVVEIGSTAMNTDDPIVEEVVRCEDLPPGSLADRRMIVRWSDGTRGEAVRFYQDEILFSEGDHGNSQLMVLACREAWCSWLDRRERGT
jgi:hypothetical protein